MALEGDEVIIGCCRDGGLPRRIKFGRMCRRVLYFNLQMTTNECFSLVVQILIAIGTIGAVFCAIWGDWVRSVLASAKIKIEAPTAELTYRNDRQKVIFWLTRIKNQRPWLEVKCIVLLVGMLKKNPATGEFEHLPLNFPLPFRWSSIWDSMSDNGYLTFTDERTIDFGCLDNNSDRFCPSFKELTPNSFQGYIKKGETIRYMLRPSATNTTSGNIQTFEVFWDGVWTDNLELMNARHLVIKEIK